MSQEENNDTQPSPIWKLGELLNKKSPPIMEGPGVYYLTIDEYGEFYIIEQDSPIISDTAKSYGKRHPNYACLLFYSIEDVRSGSKIIDYELEKYAVSQGIPGHDSSTLHTAAAYGTEYHPEYFGAYPAPIHTPWGYTLRYRSIENGIFWLETDRGQEALTICYPIWNACLPKTIIQLGTVMECDRKRGIDISLGYIFYRKPDTCIPIFELMKTHQDWGQTGHIAVPELMNAIWQNHPGYVLLHNTREQLGLNDIICGLLAQLGIGAEPNIAADNMITLFPSVGTEYIRF